MAARDDHDDPGQGTAQVAAALLLVAPDAIIVIDGDGLVREFNPAAQALFGYSRADAVGREVAELIIPPHLRQEHRDRLRRRLSAGADAPARVLEVAGRTRDGDEIALDVTVISLPGAVAQRSLFAGFLRPRNIVQQAECDGRRRSERMSFLAQAGLVLDSSLEYNETLRNLAELLVPDLAYLTVIDLLDEAGSVIEMAVAACRVPEQARAVERLRGTSRLPVSSSHPVGVVLRSGRPLLLPVMSGEFLGTIAQNNEHLDLMRGMGYRSAIVVPLVARGRTLGTLSLLRMSDTPSYGEDELVIAEELARRAGLAVDNARLFESTRHLARTLQRSLLPASLAEVPGVRLTARYHAAQSGQEVGGDFFDVFALDDGGWGITIGDVCGKGAEAAALTALARHTIRAVAGADPAAALTRLNRAVIREQDVVDGRFLTALYAHARQRGDRLTLRLAAGGHPSPLIMRAAGEVERVVLRGPLIGMSRDPEFPVAGVDLAPGDIMVLYTDGLTDAQAPRRVLSEDDLISVLADGRGLTGDALADHIEQRATEGHSARDDIALLVLERVRPAAGGE